MTGSEAAIVIIKDEKGDKTVKASFSHSYGGDPDPFIAVDPPVRKSVKGAPPEDAVFKFRLRAADNDAGYAVSDMPMPEGSSGREKYVTVTGEGEEEFGEWTYTRPGTYIYDISEVDTGLKDYKYDKRMFTITDTVTLKDGVFSVSRTIVDSNGKVVQNTLIRSNDDESAVRLGFVNEYTGNGSDDGNKDKDKDKDKDKEDGGRRIWRNVKTGDVVRLAPYFSAVLATIILLIVFIRRRRSTSN